MQKLSPLFIILTLLVGACGADDSPSPTSSTKTDKADSTEIAAPTTLPTTTASESAADPVIDNSTENDSPTATGESNTGDSSTEIDITSAHLTNRGSNCADFAATYTSDALDVESNTIFMGTLTVEISNGMCTFTSNAIPNHNFNDTGGFVNGVSEQELAVSITANPQLAAKPTTLSLQYDNAILLNGVKVDLLAAGCYGVADGFIGCNDMTSAWRYDPMYSGNDFGTDSHNAHTQPGGEYHYHGNPNALFDDSDASEVSPVIGFAADGFPIFGSYIDNKGTIRKATASYQLLAGDRPTGNGNPGGMYDGAFIDDYEYIAGSGDLDMCNGMTIDGVYGYYVTDDYPHVLGCFSGTPDISFQKATGAVGQAGGNGGGPPDLSAAAEILGLTEQELIDAFGAPPPDLEAAAATLDITLKELQEALEASLGDG